MLKRVWGNFGRTFWRGRRNDCQLLNFFTLVSFLDSFMTLRKPFRKLFSTSCISLFFFTSLREEENTAVIRDSITLINSLIIALQKKLGKCWNEFEEISAGLLEGKGWNEFKEKLGRMLKVFSILLWHSGNHFWHPAWVFFFREEGNTAVIRGITLINSLIVDLNFNWQSRCWFWNS